MRAAARIRTAMTERIITAQTFYVSSFTQTNGEYTVKRFRSDSGHSMSCNCPDFSHRGQVLGLPCKHIHLVQMLAKYLGGWTKIKLGKDYDLNVSVSDVLQRGAQRA